MSENASDVRFRREMRWKAEQLALDAIEQRDPLSNLDGRYDSLHSIGPIHPVDVVAFARARRWCLAAKALSDDLFAAAHGTSAK